MEYQFLTISQPPREIKTGLRNRVLNCNVLLNKANPKKKQVLVRIIQRLKKHEAFKKMGFSLYVPRFEKAETHQLQKVPNRVFRSCYPD